MRDSVDFGKAFERMAVYMAGIVVGSLLGSTYGAIAGAVVVGPRGSLQRVAMRLTRSACFLGWRTCQGPLSSA